MMESSIILYDGTCGLCNRVVRFVLPRDPQERFKFASLQSEPGRLLLDQYGAAELAGVKMDSFVLIHRQRLYMKSTAGLRVAKQLRGLWPVLFLLIIVPRPIRDKVYDWIAKNRYQWFGRSESCDLPDPRYAHRFIV